MHRPKYIRITCEVQCAIKVGGTATTSSLPIGAMSPEYFGVQPGATVSVIAVPVRPEHGSWKTRPPRRFWLWRYPWESGANPIINTTAINTTGVAATNCAYLTVDSLNVVGPGSGSGATTGRGFDFEWTTAATVFPGVSITNCSISGFAGAGIFTYAQADAQTSGMLISGNTITLCTWGDKTTSGTAGIYCRGTGVFQSNAFRSNLNPHITLNTVTNCTGVAAAVNWTGAGIFWSDSLGALIDYNWADNNGANGTTTAGPTGLWCASAKNSSVRYNLSTNTKTAGGDGGGYDIDGGCDGNIFEFNVAIANAGYGFMSYEYDSANYTANSANVFRYNIGWNNGLGELRIVSGGTSGNSGQAYCNKFNASSTTVVKLENLGGATNWTIANNDFTANNAGTTDFILTNAASPTGCQFFGNNYHNNAGSFRITWNSVTYATMALWRAAFPAQETIASADTSHNVTPTYVSQLGQPAIRTYNVESARPLETSPLLNAGVDLFANFSITPGTTDMFGSTVSTSGPWSIGPGAMKSALKSVVLATTGDGTWTVPADFSRLYAVDVIGAGGTGNASSAAAGGAAFSRGYLSALSAAWSAGTSTVAYHVGAAVATSNGENTVFGATTLAAAQSLGSTAAVAAEGGKTNTGSTGGLGGSAANGVGDVKFSGGNGGTTPASGINSGGGGAADVLGNGQAGAGGSATAAQGAGGGGGAGGGKAAVQPTSTTGGSGGAGPFGNAGASGGAGAGAAGTNGSGGAGAGSAGGVGGNGGNGVDWTTNGSGGGAGSGIGASAGSGTGGLYGGGGGGRNTGLGGQGGIRVLYKTSASL
jgi:hypothetical protein